MSSAIADPHDVPEGVVHLRAAYPISRYFAAFDGAVAAAGYNAFHELIRFGVPSVFVPIERETDDQAARARHAERIGVGLAAAGPGDPRLELLARARSWRPTAAGDARAAGTPAPANGAAEAARWLEGLLGEAPRSGGPAAGVDGRRRGGRSRRPVGQRLRRALAWLASVPRTLARLGSQTISMPRPRTLVVALGVDGEELERGVSDALVQTPDPPERVLVVTDSLADRGASPPGRRGRAGPGPGRAPGRARRAATTRPFLRRRLGHDPRPAPAPSARDRDRRRARRAPGRGHRAPAPPRPPACR